MKHVVIFARRPQLGRVKTRLADDIGPVETLRFYRATLNRVARRLSAGGGWATWIGITPDDTLGQDRLYPKGVSRLAQGGGDLGQRMANCLAGFGPNPAVIVGSDIPDLDRRHVAAAFDKLRRNELVFGPSGDGGYWLVGAGQGARVGNLFADVRWSTEHALSDTLENVRSGVRVAMLDPLADIDNGDDYRKWRRRL